MKNFLYGRVAFCFLVSILYQLPVDVLADQEICATVKLEIPQEVSLERQAFEANMHITNTLDTLSLDQLQVQLTFEDDEGNSVIATSDSTSTDAQFFIRLSSTRGVTGIDGTGSLPSGQSADIRWLIIPASQAAGDLPSGRRYFVGADVHYTFNGESQSLDVAPDFITVTPPPLLQLDYFMPETVIGDDAQTGIIEKSEPYEFMTRLSNIGLGETNQFVLQNPKPLVVSNDQNLPIDFDILQGYLNDQPSLAQMNLNFGALSGKSIKTAHWKMLSPVAGNFMGFSTSASHSAELGGELTSLFKVNSPHYLVKRIQMDLPGRDFNSDILAQDDDIETGQRILRVYESEYLNDSHDPCIACSDVTKIENVILGGEQQRAGGVVSRELSTPQANGLAYIQIPDPYKGEKELTKVTRSDGKTLLLQNIWLSKTRAKSETEYSYWINIFDTDAKDRYSLVFGSLSDIATAPIIQFISDRETYEGSQVGFVVRTYDINGTVPYLSLENLPNGAQFEQQGNGQGMFTWFPQLGQAGFYPLTFMASDGQFVTSTTVNVKVNPADDKDGDGMKDDWELQHFGNLLRDGKGDYDKDGFTDLEEFIHNTPPQVAARIPGAPAISSPIYGDEVLSSNPDLVVTNGEHDANQILTYEFEVYTDQAMTQLLTSQEGIEEGSITTQFSLTEDQFSQAPRALMENSTYYWRARSVTFDNTLKVASSWVSGRFFVNTINDAPTDFRISYPASGEVVSNALPLIEVNNSSDPDDAHLTYGFEIFTSANGAGKIASVTGIPQGPLGTTSWKSNVPLTGENVRYYWQATASDEHGLTKKSLVASFLFSTTNEAPYAPIILTPQAGSERGTQAIPMTVYNAVDPEQQPLLYRYELDTVNTFNTLEHIFSGDVNEGELFSTWTANYFEDNTKYFWRVQSHDGELSSPWQQGNFFVNLRNDAPSSASINNPGHDTLVQSIRPRLIVNPATDIDGDSLKYRYEVYANAAMTQLVASRVLPFEHWQIDVDLEDYSHYYWRVQTEDEHGLVSAWSTPHHFFVNLTGVNKAPSLEFILPNKELQAKGGFVDIQWQDEDIDSGAKISLYYNGSNVINQNIEEDLDGQNDSYRWFIGDLAAGEYQVSAIIEDSDNIVYSNACCTFTKLPTSNDINVELLSEAVTSESGEATVEVAVSLNGPLAQDTSLNMLLRSSNTNEGVLLNDTGNPVAIRELTFNEHNWFEPQVITLKGVVDCKADGDQDYFLNIQSISSTDVAFQNASVNDVVLTNKDEHLSEQFICGYRVAQQSPVTIGNDVYSDVRLFAKLHNQGLPINSASADVSLVTQGLSLQSSASLTFSSVMQNNTRESHESFVVRVPAGASILNNNLIWSIVPGESSPVTNGDSTDDVITGSDGFDVIDAGEGNDVINAGGGDDIIIAGIGQDVINAGAGDDIIIVQSNDPYANTVNGGDGYDTVLSGEQDDRIVFSDFTGQNRVEEIDGGAGINDIYGTSSDDQLDFSDTLLNNINSINGGAGDDQITGSDNNDTIQGGAGSDTLDGGLGDDTFVFSGFDVGFDRVIGGEGFDQMLGTELDDTLRLAEFTSIELIDGKGGHNVITGTEEDDVLDLSNTSVMNIALISGLAGNDVITGSITNDVISGGLGDDTLIGGLGDDTFVINGIEGVDNYDGGEGADSISGGVLDDVLQVESFTEQSSIETIDLNGGNNIVRGTDNDNTLDFSVTTLMGVTLIEGLAGNDLILGSLQNDVISGGAGNDHIKGNTGSDTLKGDAGNDRLEGGLGADVYEFDANSGVDIVLDPLSLTETDKLVFKNISNLSELNFSLSNKDLVITNVENPDSQTITIPYWTKGNTSQYWVVLNDGSETNIEDLAFSGVTVLGSDFNDELIGDAEINKIFGGSGNDKLIGLGNDDLLSGGAGDDILIGGAGEDYLIGGNGNDKLFDSVKMLDAITPEWLNPEEGVLIVSNDTFYGGPGNDEIWGGGGDDLYIFNKGDGKDVINDYPDLSKNLSSSDFLNQGKETIQFGEGISLDDLEFSFINNDLVIDIHSGQDQLLIKEWLFKGMSVDCILAGIYGNTEACNNQYRFMVKLFSNELFLLKNIVNDKLIEASRTGTDSHDRYFGYDGRDIIEGGDGSDALYGSNGDDYLSGGAGNDYLSGELGNDELIGGDGNDILFAALGDNILDGGAGVDRLFCGSGDNVSSGGDGNDIIEGGSGTDLMNGDSGEDILIGHNGDDQLHGGEGDDKLSGSKGNDQLKGDIGSDILIGAAGNDYLNGGDGDDKLYDSVRSLSTAKDAPDWAHSGEIPQILSHDILEGGAGNDELWGDAGNDVYIFNTGHGVDVINDTPARDSDFHENFALQGNEVLQLGQNISKEDLILSLNNSDLVITYNNSSDQITIVDWLYGLGTSTNQNRYSLKFSDSSILHLASLLAEHVPELSHSGTILDDTISGYSGKDNIESGAGDDIIHSLAGDDYVMTGIGNDKVFAGSGNDVVYGEDGRDYLVGESGDDTLYGGNGIDELYGQAGVDSLYGGTGADKLDGGSGNDILYGEEDADTLNGGTGDDYLDGGASNDLIYGGQGSDILKGGEGDDKLHDDAIIISGYWVTFAPKGLEGDILEGGLGNDELKAGYGDDTYIFNRGDGQDEIHDFLLENQLTAALYAQQGQETIQFGEGINDVDLEFELIESDLLIKIIGTSDQITIKNWFVSSGLYSNMNRFSIQWSFSLKEKLYDVIRRDTEFWEHIDLPENLSGLSDADIIFGYGGNDLIHGNGGDDQLSGGYGEDILYGDSGNDTANGDDGNDTIYGGPGNDYLFGDSGDDEIHGEAGNDNLNGGLDGDILNGGDGADILNGGDGNDQLFGGAGIDQLNGGAGNDVLRDTDFTKNPPPEIAYLGVDLENYIGSDDSGETYIGGLGNDTIWGGRGNDTYIFNLGDGSDSIIDTARVYEYANWADNGFSKNFSKQGIETIKFGEGIVKEDLEFSLTANDLYIHIKNTSDSIRIAYWVFAYRPFQYGENYNNQKRFNVSFHDGTVLNLKSFVPQVLPTNTREGTASQDYMVGYDGQDIFNGGANGGLEYLNGFGGNDIINGGDGSDMIHGGSGNDTLNGENDNDSIFGGSGSDAISGGAGNDTLDGGTGSDTISGGEGEDKLHGYSGNNVLDGGIGNDIIIGGTGSDTLIGGEGDDLLSDGALYRYKATTPQYENPQNGGLSHDVLQGGKGNDELWGGQGNDRYIFNLGDGRDVINDITALKYSSKHNQNFEKQGIDTIQFGEGISIDNLIFELAGNNLVLKVKDTSDQLTILSWAEQYGAYSNQERFNVQFFGSVAEPIRELFYANVSEYVRSGSGVIHGWEGRDVITGNSTNDKLYGYGNNDQLNGGGGHDYLYGGDGADVLAGGDGIDRLYGDSGNDSLYGQAGSDSLYGGLGSDVLSGGTEADYLDGGDGSDKLNGGDGNDTLYGADGNDTLEGGDGDDNIVGGKGFDNMIGGAGDDRLYDQAQISFGRPQLDKPKVGWGSEKMSDRLEGGAGNDQLWGGYGSDTYVFNLGDGQDSIVDYAAGYINGSDIYTQGKEVLKFGVGVAASNLSFNLKNNDLEIQYSSSDAVVIRNWLVTGLWSDGRLSDCTAYADYDECSNQDRFRVALFDGSLIDVRALVNEAILENEREITEELAIIFGFDGNDKIFGTTQSNRIYGMSGNDEIYGGLGNDKIYGVTGNNILKGDGGNDTIIGGNYGDDIHGGTGDDVLNGAQGNDSYFFGLGDGIDTISDTTGNEYLVFGETILSSDLFYSYVGNDLHIDIANSTDRIVLKNMLNGDLSRFTLVFTSEPANP